LLTLYFRKQTQMIIDTDDLAHWTGYAQGLIRLAMQEQSRHDAQRLKHEAAKTAATEAVKLVKEANAAPQPVGLNEIDRLTAEVERLDDKIDAAGISRDASTDGCGLRAYHPLVSMLRQAQWRLKQAVDARDRVFAMTGCELFGRSL
jgi:hypothetical protein